MVQEIKYLLEDIDNRLINIKKLLLLSEKEIELNCNINRIGVNDILKYIELISKFTTNGIINESLLINSISEVYSNKWSISEIRSCLDALFRMGEIYKPQEEELKLI